MTTKVVKKIQEITSFGGIFHLLDVFFIIISLNSFLSPWGKDVTGMQNMNTVT